MKLVYDDIRQGLTEAINLERQVSELEDVIASQNALFESFVDDLCQIIFEGENTNIGREITIDRIKEMVKYDDWLKEE